MVYYDEQVDSWRHVSPARPTCWAVHGPHRPVLDAKETDGENEIEAEDAYDILAEQSGCHAFFVAMSRYRGELILQFSDGVTLIIESANQESLRFYKSDLTGHEMMKQWEAESHD